MAFCTECGSKLPDDAIFCPNCGTSLNPQVNNDGGQTDKIVPEEKQSEEVAAPLTEEKQPEPAAVAGAFRTNGTYEMPSQGSYTPPIQGTYVPPVQETYTPPVQNSGAQSYQGSYTPPQPQYNAPSYGYGYSPQGGVGVATSPKKKLSAGAIVAIVLGSIILLFAILVIIGFVADDEPYVGYWESAAVDVGNGVISEDYYGMSVVGALGIQINSDDTAYLASTSSSDIIDGTWQEAKDGIVIYTVDESFVLTYEDEQLVLTEEGETYYFNKIKGRDINNPTIPHGSRSDDYSGDSRVADSIAGSGNVGDGNYYISVTGAESFLDIDGEPAIRIYFDFTNNYQDDYSTSAYDALSYYASQDGSNLTETYSYDDNAAYNLSYNIRPGITIQCCAEFKYDPYGGIVDFGVYGYYEEKAGGVVTASYTPANLPGAPAPYVIVPVTNPQWTLNIPEEDDLDNFHVAVKDAELITDSNGNSAIRIYYDFTNNESYSTSLSNELYVFTYQDGISLDYTYATEESETDSNYYVEIAPGKTITCSCIFALRNDKSPVEAEVEAYYDYNAVGQTYNIGD